MWLSLTAVKFCRQSLFNNPAQEIPSITFCVAIYLSQSYMYIYYIYMEVCILVKQLCEYHSSYDFTMLSLGSGGN